MESPMVYASKKGDKLKIKKLLALFSINFTIRYVEVGVMLCSLVIFQFLLGIEYISAFSTHVLPRSGAWIAFTLYDLTQFSTSSLS